MRLHLEVETDSMILNRHISFAREEARALVPLRGLTCDHRVGHMNGRNPGVEVVDIVNSVDVGLEIRTLDDRMVGADGSTGI